MVTIKVNRLQHGLQLGDLLAHAAQIRPCGGIRIAGCNRHRRCAGTHTRKQINGCRGKDIIDMQPAAAVMRQCISCRQQVVYCAADCGMSSSLCLVNRNIRSYSMLRICYCCIRCCM